MAMASGDKASELSVRAKEKLSNVSRKFGCLFGNNAAKLNETRSKSSKCVYGDCKCGSACLASLGIETTNSAKLCDCTLPCRFNNLYYKYAMGLDGRSTTCPSFCPGCDFHFPPDFVNMEECKIFHDTSLQLSRKLIEGLTFCKNNGSYPWKVFQIQDWGEDMANSEIAKKFKHLPFGRTFFYLQPSQESQVFLALTDTEPARILGYCRINPVYWVRDSPGYNPRVDYREYRQVSPNQITVDALWVHKPDRRRGVAKSLLDAARYNFFADSIVSKEAIDIQCPTEYGSAFAETYFENSDYDD